MDALQHWAHAKQIRFRNALERKFEKMPYSAFDEWRFRKEQAPDTYALSFTGPTADQHDARFHGYG